MEDTPHSSEVASLATLHRALRLQVAESLTAVELIELAAPHSRPLTEIARTNLRQALQTIEDAAELEGTISLLLASPFPLRREGI